MNLDEILATVQGVRDKVATMMADPKARELAGKAAEALRAGHDLMVAVQSGDHAQVATTLDGYEDVARTRAARNALAAENEVDEERAITISRVLTAVEIAGKVAGVAASVAGVL